MIEKLEKLITKLGVFNHAVFALILMPIIALILKFTGIGYGAAFVVCLAYYFREHAMSRSYNPLKWTRFDRVQSVILVMVSFGTVFVVKHFYGGF